MRPRLILKHLIVKSIVLFFVVMLAGCVVIPAMPSPLPTPTSVSGIQLPIEPIYSGSICGERGAETQLFFMTSREAWDDVWLSLMAKYGLSFDASEIAQEIESTDFQTQALLLARRACQPATSYLIAVQRVVEVSATYVYVYISLLDPTPLHGGGAAETGAYQIVRIPWSHDDNVPPKVTVVDYTQFRDIDE